VKAIHVSVRRGGAVESRHLVHAAAVRDGEVVAAAGDPGLVTFFRSSAKPLQALPLVRARDDLDTKDVAIACASHQAEPGQLGAVRHLLAKAPATEEDLECGFDEGRPRERIYHNCSGKHAGFLALCRARSWETRGYRLPEHPLQQELTAEISRASGRAADEIPTGTDGCGVVTFALPLEAMAFAFARLSELEGGAALLAAMQAYPELVGGEGAADTDLMRTLPGWTAKRGGEGLLCAVSPDGLALAAKVEDGNPRALRPALERFLDTLGVSVREDFARVGVSNSRGEEVGEVTAE
jgi:L-asparaginase II